MKIEVVNLDELCDEVNRALLAQGISVADGRTASVVTPRNVRYYRTIGLLKPPTRRDGRAVYGQNHIDEIVAIKQAQHDGISLEQLIEQRKKTETRQGNLTLNFNPSMSEVVEKTVIQSFLTTTLPELNISSLKSDEVFGWSVHLGDIVLSGTGTPPNRQQIAAILEILN